MSIQEDLKKYPCYVWEQGILKNIPHLEHWGFGFQIHHFVRQAIRKNSPEFYARVEHLQKLILMPSGMNYDLEVMGEEKFLQKYGVNKNDFVFSRKKWREGYYDS